MIKIEINAESGAEARQQLLDLLGGTISINTPENGQKISDLKTVETEAKKSTMIIVDDPKENIDPKKAEAFVETATKKRRTKAEIEADKIREEANSVSPGGPAPDKINEVDEIQEDHVETLIQDNKEQNSGLSNEDKIKALQKKAVELGRVGKKPLCLAVLNKYGADSISTPPRPLNLDHFEEVMAELEKL